MIRTVSNTFQLEMRCKLRLSGLFVRFKFDCKIKSLKKDLGCLGLLIYFKIFVTMMNKFRINFDKIQFNQTCK